MGSIERMEGRNGCFLFLVFRKGLGRFYFWLLFVIVGVLDVSWFEGFYEVDGILVWF